MSEQTSVPVVFLNGRGLGPDSGLRGKPVPCVHGDAGGRGRAGPMVHCGTIELTDDERATVLVMSTLPASGRLPSFRWNTCRAHQARVSWRGQSPA